MNASQDCWLAATPTGRLDAPRMATSACVALSPPAVGVLGWFLRPDARSVWSLASTLRDLHHGSPVEIVARLSAGISQHWTWNPAPKPPLRSGQRESPRLNFDPPRLPE